MPEGDDIDSGVAQLPCIEIIEGRSKGRLFPLRPGLYVIGRLVGVEIPLDDPGISRRHVKLTVRADGNIEALDMRSTNGTWINGIKTERIVLDDGDVISIGPDASMRLAFYDESTIAKREQAYQDAVAQAVAAAVEVASPAPVLRLISRNPDGDDATVMLRQREATSPAAAAFQTDAEQPLSARQLEVSRLVAEGLTNAAIAEQLGISPRTVTSHLDHIYGRLGIGSRAALTRWIVERGLTK
ncbi:MAG: FHA domain-containing protein [Myxococcales bacterium]|nr:FHA domain-containing protein [Myxococcales bacterium]